MNAAGRKRVRDMKRRNEQKRRRQYFIRRIVAVLVGIAVLIIAIVGIKGCGDGSSPLSSDPKVTILPAQTVPPATQPPISSTIDSNTPINQDFYKNSCFVGNSVVESMEVYELIDDVDYFARIGLNVTDAAKLSTTNGSVPVIDELNNDKKYSRIFMMFGENELNWSSIDTFKTSYAGLIKKAKQYQPQAKIYLLSITPISKTADAEERDGATKEAIVKFNQYIKDVADKNGVIYTDIYSALADENGFLPEGVAADGIHFDKEYYQKFLVYIQQNYNQ